MAQRQMYASMGALRRSLGAGVASVQACSSRALHGSARRLEEQASDASPAQPPNSRRVRSAAALKQIASLQYRRQPGALARGSFPSGQMLRRSPRPPTSQANEYGFIPEDDASANTQQDASASARAARNTAGPRTSRGSAPPPGQMARAPSTLRRSRAGADGATRGPNLRGRDARTPAAGGKRSAAGGNRGEAGPKRREKTSGGDETMSTRLADVELGDTISDAMTQQLLRLQRKEWDRTPYEPRYAKGSFAANELIHAGRELFKGESPPVKLWGPLERRIGVVGMFGAEAHLKVRRVLDGDAEPFGQEVIEEEEEEEEVKGVEKNREEAVLQ